MKHWQLCWRVCQKYLMSTSSTHVLANLLAVKCRQNLFSDCRKKKSEMSRPIRGQGSHLLWNLSSETSLIGKGLEPLIPCIANQTLDHYTMWWKCTMVPNPFEILSLTPQLDSSLTKIPFPPHLMLPNTVTRNGDVADGMTPGTMGWYGKGRQVCNQSVTNITLLKFYIHA